MGYSDSEVAHRFATGIGERCTGSHMFFEGNVIYSYGYHFKIAIKWDGKVLFNDQSYSNSTSKHQNYVFGACSHMDIVHCATLTPWNTCESKPTKGFIDENLHLWEHEVDGLVSSMAVARRPEIWLDKILHVVDKVERFCEVFGEAERKAICDKIIEIYKR